MSFRAIRSRIGELLHRLGLLGLADRILYGLDLLVATPSNVMFRRAHPGFAAPPARIAFETLGHVSSSEFETSGRRHARLIMDTVRELHPAPVQAVLEWGCGCGRVIRQLRPEGLASEVRLIGVDVDAAAIAWCRSNLPGIEFHTCGALPPLPIGDRALDVIYHYSVWTHLSAANVAAWVEDMARAMRDDGIMIGTTHGERYADMLSVSEASAFHSGQVIERRGAAEGRKRFLAFHPAEFVREMLLRHFRHVRLSARADDPTLPQDMWAAWGPRR